MIIDTSNFMNHQKQPESAIFPNITQGNTPKIRFVKHTGEWVIYCPMLVEDINGNIKSFASNIDALDYLNFLGVSYCEVDGR